MSTKKNNHIIPKCVIKQWSIVSNGRQGVFVYETERAKIDFSSAKGSRGFSFAIESYFYAPKDGDQRIFKVEEWLAGIENTLAIFISAVKSDTYEYLMRSRHDFTKLLLALFSLKNRTKYGLQQIKKFLISKAEYRDLMGFTLDENVDIVVLENLINSTTEEAIEYATCEIRLFKCPSRELILGDRPFLNNIVDGHSFIALSPQYLLSICRASGPPSFTRHDHLDNSMKDSFNRMVAQNSRFWIAAHSRELLETYIPYFKEEKSDLEPYYETLKFLQHGYKIS